MFQLSQYLRNFDFLNENTKVSRIFHFFLIEFVYLEKMYKLHDSIKHECLLTKILKTAHFYKSTVPFIPPV